MGVGFTRVGCQICRLQCSAFHLVIVLSVLRLTASNSSFAIFKFSLMRSPRYSDGMVVGIT